MILPDVACAGCDRIVPGPEIGWTWILGALGMVAVKTHRDPGCADLAVDRHAEQPARRVPEPMGKAELMVREAQAAKEQRLKGAPGKWPW